MDERDYIMLHYIYEEKNITRAAERLYTSQPSLTYRIQQIEKNLGIQVLVRNGKSIEFTPEGEYLASFARQMLAHIRDFQDNLANISSKVQGTLRIASTSITARYYLPKVLKAFSGMYPNINIQVDTGKSGDVIQALENEEVHVGMVRGEYDWPEKKDLICRETICLIAKEEIDLAQLPRMHRIFHRSSKGTYKTKHHDTMSEKILTWWNERFSTPPLFSMQVGSYEACKEMVINGLGYAIVPRDFIKPDDDLYVQNLVLKSGEVLCRNTWLLYRESCLELLFVKKFVDYIQSLPSPVELKA
ncbi:LysR family transcriptional regulator [Brevibacillus sp. TJ4]|uniref:LysR family transcriptional regulator n=1 Tax=Brevibacillus sp. TJ4 TaxID=3234853 RepID=UPI0037D0B49C